MSRIWAHDRRICFFWVACGDDTVDQAKAQSRWLSSRNTTKLLRSPVMHRWLNSGARTMDIRADGQPGRRSFRRHGWRIPRPMARSWGFSTMAGRVAGSSDSYPVRFLLCHGGRLKNARGERERETENFNGDRTTSNNDATFRNLALLEPRSYVPSDFSSRYRRFRFSRWEFLIVETRGVSARRIFPKFLTKVLEKTRN